MYLLLSTMRWMVLLRRAALAVALERESDRPIATSALLSSAMNPLFAATIDATEEAVHNALLKATTVRSSRGKLVEIPIDSVVSILDRYNARRRN
ncbi:MAG: P1 family peptidase [Woeseiaceae bacterium]